MSYFGQLQRFDPILEEVPDGPITGLSSIALRARHLLAKRTSDEIHTVAKAIDFAIYCYFDEIKQGEIERLRRNLNGLVSTPRRFKRESSGMDFHYDAALREFEKYFQWDGGTIENGHWLFKEEMECELDIPTPENTTELEALKECADCLDEIGGQGFSDSEAYEVYAVLSLWMVADALESIRFEFEVPTSYSDITVKTESSMHQSRIYSLRLAIAAECALKAMDAVCFAEHLREMSKLQASQLDKERVRLESERRKRSIRGQELNIARHQKRNEAQDKVLKEWEKMPTKFPSAEKAGLYFADWLTQKGFQFEPRTVTGWVRVYAKKIGIKFR